MSDVKIWRWFFNDLEKEEAWLNEMAGKGLNLVVPGKLGPPPYRFVRGTPGEWIYRIEFLPWTARSKKGKRYLAFVAESGIETVHSSGQGAYFRRQAADGSFEVFSDLDSRIAHFRRLRGRLAFIAIPQILTIVSMVLILLSPTPEDGPLVTAMVVVVGLSLVVEAMAISQVARESRRIKALAAQKALFE